uniref:Uncharacterized protein n=1 Tax=Oryza sativa subsp. japonica TaxID=39947 RepID=Q5Z475_ORYSJ|nr:hypothetical protein [Oryza sativa Japonica Group]
MTDVTGLIPVMSSADSHDSTSHLLPAKVETTSVSSTSTNRAVKTTSVSSTSTNRAVKNHGPHPRETELGEVDPQRLF